MLTTRHRPEYRGSFVAGSPPPATYRPFVWHAVASATSYTLQVGTGTGLSDTYNADVGNVLTKTIALQSGTYCSRVVAYQDSTPIATLAEETFTV